MYVRLNQGGLNLGHCDWQLRQNLIDVDLLTSHSLQDDLKTTPTLYHSLATSPNLSCDQQSDAEDVMATYRPISTTQFRVVHILLGQFADPLHCILETQPSEVKTSYEALSYEWGAGSIARRFINITHHASPFRAREVTDASQPNSILSGNLNGVGPADRSIIMRYKSTLIGIVTLMLAFPTWHWAFAAGDSPAWLEPFIVQAFISLVCSYSMTATFIGAIQMIFEIARTKPWFLVLDRHTLMRTSIFQLSTSSAFNTIAVTPNLDLALRHLRLTSQRRTLWIDALCINQEDEDEKMAQIQRMGLIYANASAVVIWLGDCHGIGSSPPCSELLSQEGPRGCRHEREIAEAFNFISLFEAWTSLIHWILGHHRLGEDIQLAHYESFQAASQGLLSIVQRGWWRRLWVIQEVVLGTGRVYIQCGHHMCEFERFQRVRHFIWRSDVGMDFLEEFASSRRFVSIVEQFQTFSLDPPTHPDFRILYVILASGVKAFIVSRFGKSDEHRRLQYLGQLYPQRLLRVLLKTAGYFECRDNKDRLVAVLGIVAGIEEGPSMIAKLIEYISWPSKQIYLMKLFCFITGCSFPRSMPRGICSIAIEFLSIAWSKFYDGRVGTGNR